MKRLLLLCMALWPAAAWADPVSLIVLGVQALGAFGVISATTAALISIGAAVFGGIEARRKQKAARARARAAYNASLQDRSVTTLRADPPWRVVYGRAIVGGEIVAIFTSDKAGTRTNGSAYTKADGLKHLVIAIATHASQAINEVYVDGVALGTLDGSGNVTGGEFLLTQNETREISIAAGASSVQPSAVTVLNAWDELLSTPLGGEGSQMVAGSYTLTSGNTTINNTGANAMRVSFTLAVGTASVKVQKHLGGADQAADSYLTGLLPSEWTATDRLRGITYAVVTLDLENQRFQGGPPNITFDVSGRLVLDPRTGLTAWSDNPALCVRDFLVNEWGFNCAEADVDDAYTIAAANACDVPIDLTVGASTTTGPTYTSNGAFTSEQGKEGVLQELLEAMAGTATYGARWLIQAGAWTPPVMDLTDADLHGQIEVVQGGAGMDDAFNTVRGSYIPAGGAVPADFDVYANATFVAADGESLYEDVALPFTDHKARCRNLARIMVERNRDGLVVRYPAKLRAWPLQVGDRVTVTSAEFGWSAKTFRVTDWQFGLASPVELLLQEDAPAVYDLADAATSDPAANTLLPNPWVVAAPSGVTITSGTGTAGVRDGSIGTRVRVGWTMPTDPYLADGGGVMLIRWRRQLRDADNVWQALPPVPASEVFAFIDGVVANDVLTIELRLRNGIGALSPPVYYSHAVTTNASTVITAQIAPSAATVIVTASGSNGSVAADETNIIDGAESVTLCSAAYNNDTGATINVQLEAQVYAKVDITGTGARYAWFAINDGTNDVVQAPISAASTIPVAETTADYRSYTLIGNVSQGTGSTTYSLLAKAHVTSGSTPDTTVTNTYGPSTLRVTAIKR